MSIDLIIGSSCRAAPSSRLVCLLPAMVVSPIAYGGPLALPESERPAGPKQYGRGVHGLCIYQYRYVFIYIYICTCICIYIKHAYELSMPGPATPHPPPRGCGGYPSLSCGNRRLGGLCGFISIRRVHDGLSAVKTCHGLSSWGVKLEMCIFPFELHPGSCRSNNVKPPVLQRQGFNVTTWRGGPSCSSVLRRWRGQGAF